MTNHKDTIFAYGKSLKQAARYAEEDLNIYDPPRKYKIVQARLVKALTDDDPEYPHWGQGSMQKWVFQLHRGV